MFIFYLDLLYLSSYFRYLGLYHTWARVESCQGGANYFRSGRGANFFIAF